MNATASKPGLLPKLSSTSAQYLDGTGNWSVPPSSGGTTISYPGSTSVFLNGNGAWTIPAASGSIFKPGIYIGKSGSGADYECDGSADNVQFQACLDAVISGTTIYVLPGTYNFTTRIYCSGKSLNIIGIGTVLININTAAGATVAANGVVLTGTSVITTTPTVSAVKGDTTLTLTDISSTQAGDLLKIYNNTLWCQYDYTTHKTGEMYEIKSVSGNTVTLNEPLLRDYSTSNGTGIVVYRPIEVHIENIDFVCTASGGNTGMWECFFIQRAKNSSISGCNIKNFGFAAISLYSCFNVHAFRNTVFNCLKAGSGYGVGFWSGTAHGHAYNNHIEMCRHCVTINTDELISLARDLHVNRNVCIGGNITGANVIDAHPCAIDYYIEDNMLYPKASYWAFDDGALISTFKNNKVYGGYVGICRRGALANGTHIYEGNYFEGTALAYGYKGFTNDNDSPATNERLVYKNNIMVGGRWGMQFDKTNPETYRHMEIVGNTFVDMTEDGVYIDLLNSIVNIDISNNHIINPAKTGITVNGNTFTPRSLKIQNNQLIDTGTAGIKLTGMSYAYVSGNQITDSEAKSGYAIYEEAGCANNVFIGNVAKGMTGTKFSLNGTTPTSANNISL